MDLWHGPLSEFSDLARGGGFAFLLEGEFERIHHADPSDAEVRSWTKSLDALGRTVEPIATRDVGVLIEYHLPLSEHRIDVMFFGKDRRGESSVLVELKQWPDVAIDDLSDNVFLGDVEHVHPCQQALDYAGFLQDIHSDYSNGDVTVRPCGFCHNLTGIGEIALRDGRFARLLDQSPLFAKAQVPTFPAFVEEHVGGGQGLSLVRRVRAGRFQPGPKVIDTLAAVLERDRDWHLLDVQRKAYNRIIAEVRRMQRQHSRSAVLVRGGPGTGKTVIAVQALAEMLKAGYRAAHSTGGKAFTTTLKSKFAGAASVFTWNMSLRNAVGMDLDLLLIDEAHRIRATSDTRFTKRAERNRRSQVDELLDASKVTVFLLDEHQYMRPDEIGESKLIREATERRQIPLAEYDLNTQFRCAGSAEYLEWVDFVLGYRPDPPDDWRGRYKLDFASAPEELDDYVELALASGESCRMVAGFCWPWSDPLDDGTLVDDVRIGEWSKPWNRKASDKKSYKPSNHPYTLWATTDEGEGQVGCVYSAQGFEFDRVAVIWGPDLVWREDKWVGQKKLSKDPGLRLAKGDEITRLLRNAYRVLLTRGMKGTTVLCLDDETRAHLVSTLTVAEQVA
jgi:uncharacterized protein